MKIAVKDASVLIDLLDSDLIGSWFKLGIETHVSDFVHAEIQKAEQKRLLDSFESAGLLSVVRINNNDVIQLSELSQLSRELGVSIPDASAVKLVESLDQGFLLTSDGTLRVRAERKGLEVRGLLWILDLMLWHDVISFREADKALTTVLAAGSRQPAVECQKRQEAWVAGRKIKPREPLPDVAK